MCTLTVRDFRQNLSRSLDRVDNGEDVIITRGNKYYIISEVTLAPVVTPELQARLDAARQEISRGECTVLNTPQDIDRYFDSL